MIECIAVVMLCLWRSFTRPEPVALLHMAGEQAGTAKCGGPKSHLGPHFLEPSGLVMTYEFLPNS